MSKTLWLPALALALLLARLGAQEAAPAEPPVVKEEPKATVTFAKSWDAAVEEAKLLNLPIVIHSHGFY
jgi:hypothetical protein